MADRTVKVNLTLRNEGFVAGLRQASTQAKDFGNTVLDGAKKNKGSLDTLGKGFTGVGLAAGAAFGLAVKKFADFDEAMSHVQAATHETAGNMDQLREAALQAGKDTAFSATEAAGAIENLAKAGVSTKDILGGGLKGALDLAAAGSLDVGDAAEIAATAMTQFGLSGKDVPHIADLLAAAAGKAQGEVSDVAMALKQGGLVAAQFGLSIEETTGTLAAFASAGLLGSDAGTSFKTMLLKLANPAADAAATLEELGIAAYDTKGNFVGIAPLAEQLKDKLSKLTPAQRDAALATIFGSDAIRAANVLYQQGAAGISDWTTKVNDQGYAAETAALKTDNLKGDVERLGGALDTALIQGGSGANDILRALTKTLDNAISGFSELPGWVQQGATALAGLAAVGTLGAAGLLKAATAAGELRSAWQDLSKVGKGLTLAAGGVGVALLAATAIYGAFANKNAEARQRVEDLRATLDEQTGAITGNTRAYVANQLAQSGLAEKAKAMGLSLSTVTDAALGNQSALGSLVSQLDAVIAAGTKQEFQGRAGAVSFDANAVAAQKLKDELTGMNGSLTDAQLKQKLAAEGANENKTAQELQAEAVKTANEAFVQQAQDLQDVIDTMNKMPGLVLSLRDAQRGWLDSIDAANQALKENGKTLDDTTPKGRANNAALDAMAKSANDVTESMTRNGKSNLSVVRTYEANRAGLIATYRQFDNNIGRANAYADSVLAIPKRSDTTLKADIRDLESKLKTAKEKLKDPKLTATQRAKLEADIRNLQAGITSAKAALATVPPSKTVTITTRYSIVGTKAAIAAGTRGGGKVFNDGKAGGGLIPGAPSSSDNLLLPMASGEYVVKASQVQSNLATLNAINEGRFRPTSFSSSSTVPAAAPAVTIGATVVVEMDGKQFDARIKSIQDDGNRKLKRNVRQGVVR